MLKIFQNQNRKTERLKSYCQRNEVTTKVIIPIKHLQYYLSDGEEKPQLGLYCCSYHNKHKQELTPIYFWEVTGTYSQKNVLKRKDLAYNNLKGIINNNYLAVLKSDKDSSEGIIDKSDYASKVHKMIDESINNGI